MVRKSLVSVSSLSLLIGMTFCLPGFAVNITKEDIQKSEEFLRRKAELKYTQLKSEELREVYINGLKVDDHALAKLVNDKALLEKTSEAISTRRISWGTMAGLGLPTGALLGYLAASTRPQQNLGQGRFINGQFVYNNPQAAQANQASFGNYVLGTAGVLLTLVGVVNSVMLLTDITGLKKETILNNTEVEELVNKYNENLTQDLLNQYNEKQSFKLNFENTANNGNVQLFNFTKKF